MTKYFLIFIIDEVENYAANNIIQIVGVSHWLKIYASRERRLLQDQVQLGIGVKV